tara:strand:+ start:400 stop:936 length:537 start_codon:yes stop_codon:yes gene_type:complete
MTILQRTEYKTMPWPNGGGVAHEIAKWETADRTLWRLSLADVVGECAFSEFKGLSRCTTVVSGAGMRLQCEHEQLVLEPLSPMTFCGELKLRGTLIDGPVENLNLVYDANLMTADVRIQTGVNGIDPGRIVFVVDGELMVDGRTVTRHGTAWVSEHDLSGSGVYVVMYLPWPFARQQS